MLIRGQYSPHISTCVGDSVPVFPRGIERVGYAVPKVQPVPPPTWKDCLACEWRNDRQAGEREPVTVRRASSRPGCYRALRDGMRHALDRGMAYRENAVSGRYRGGAAGTAGVRCHSTAGGRVAPGTATRETPAETKAATPPSRFQGHRTPRAAVARLGNRRATTVRGPRGSRCPPTA